MSGAVFVFIAFIATASFAMELMGARTASGAHVVEIALAGQLCGFAVALALAALWRARPMVLRLAPGMPLEPQRPWFARGALATLPGAVLRYAVFLLGWVPLALFCIPAVWRALGWTIEPQPHLAYFATPSDSPWFVGAAVSVALVGPIFEEVVFRGFLHDGLRARLGPRTTIAVVALLFGAMHVESGAYLLVPTALLGAFFGWLRERSDGLLAPIAAHVLHNAATVALVASSPAFLDEVFR